MHTITWQELKDKCASKAWDMSRCIPAGEIIREGLRGKKEGTFMRYHKRVDELSKEVVQIVDTADVRTWKQVAEQFPAQFPEWIKQGKFELEYSDNGWEFVRTGACECCGKF